MKVTVVKTASGFYVGEEVDRKETSVVLRKVAEMRMNPIFEDQLQGGAKSTTQGGQQQAPVMMNMMLIVPFEYAGIHVDENLYTGFSGRSLCVEDRLKTEMVDYGFHMMKSKVFSKVTGFMGPFDGIVDPRADIEFHNVLLISEASSQVKKLYSIYCENFDVLIRSPKSCYIYFGDNRQVEFVRSMFGDLVIPQASQEAEVSGNGGSEQSYPSGTMLS